jgi:hypothetical protein
MQLNEGIQDDTLSIDKNLGLIFDYSNVMKAGQG